MKYNKLVRDGIPEYIQRKGGMPIFYVADEKEYWERLKEKLGEEVSEFAKSEKMEEIADVFEVLEAVCDYKKFDMADVRSVKNEKAAERGKFKNKIILDES